jgi:hypothetical protein
MNTHLPVSQSLLPRRALRWKRFFFFFFQHREALLPSKSEQADKTEKGLHARH